MQVANLVDLFFTLPNKSSCEEMIDLKPYCTIWSNVHRHGPEYNKQASFSSLQSRVSHPSHLLEAEGYQNAVSITEAVLDSKAWLCCLHSPIGWFLNPLKSLVQKPTTSKHANLWELLQDMVQLWESSTNRKLIMHCEHSSLTLWLNLSERFGMPPGASGTDLRSHQAVFHWSWRGLGFRASSPTPTRRFPMGSRAFTGDVLWDLVKGVEALASWQCRTLCFGSIAPFEKHLMFVRACLRLSPLSEWEEPGRLASPGKTS